MQAVVSRGGGWDEVRSRTWARGRRARGANTHAFVLDPAKLAQRGLTASAVVNALQEQTCRCRGPGWTAATPTGKRIRSVAGGWAAFRAGAIPHIVLKTGADGTLVRLKDVGRSELGAED